VIQIAKVGSELKLYCKNERDLLPSIVFMIKKELKIIVS